MIATRVPGARLSLPRDLEDAYVAARMGAITAAHLAELRDIDPRTARHGLGRLRALGIVRAFSPTDPSRPTWYSPTADGLAWIIAEASADPSEVRSYAGLGRVNLPALDLRNRIWISFILACRSRGVRLAIFRTEAELRRHATGLPVVPDALVVLARHEDDAGVAFAVELDLGTERLIVWERKATSYADLARRHTPIFGARAWKVVAIVPSARRAVGVARAVVTGGAGNLMLVGVAGELVGGRILDPVFVRASGESRVALVEFLAAANSLRRPPPTVGGGLDEQSIENPAGDAAGDSGSFGVCDTESRP